MPVTYLEAPHGTELDHLQGAWQSVADQRKARLLIAGQHFAFELDDQQVFMGSFSLAVDSAPKGIDMHVDEGPAEYCGQTAQCIYDVNGDTLRWCSGKPGSGRRPTSFPHGDDKSYLSLTFERSHAARPQPPAYTRPEEFNILLCDLDD